MHKKSMIIFNLSASTKQERQKMANLRLREMSQRIKQYFFESFYGQKNFQQNPTTN